jgi:hypothetical protein
MGAKVDDPHRRTIAGRDAGWASWVDRALTAIRWSRRMDLTSGQYWHVARLYKLRRWHAYGPTGIASTHRSICRVENWSQKGGVLRIPKCCFEIGFSAPDYSYDLSQDRHGTADGRILGFAGNQSDQEIAGGVFATVQNRKTELRRNAFDDVADRCVRSTNRDQPLLPTSAPSYRVNAWALCRRPTGSADPALLIALPIHEQNCHNCRQDHGGDRVRSFDERHPRFYPGLKGSSSPY